MAFHVILRIRLTWQTVHFTGITKQCLALNNVVNGTVDHCKFYDCSTDLALIALSNSNALSFSNNLISSCDSQEGITINSCESIDNIKCSISNNTFDDSAITIQNSTNVSLKKSSIGNNTFSDTNNVNIINIIETKDFILRVLMQQEIADHQRILQLLMHLVPNCQIHKKQVSLTDALFLIMLIM